MRETFTRDGFVIARGLLESAEIARLRAALLDHFSRQWEPEGLGCHQPRAALEIPSIGWIFSHPGIAATVKELTGSPTPVFTTNCDAHMNMLSWWHKDTGEGLGGCFEGDYFNRDTVRVCRAGIYLQDHETNSHGLHVRTGSHHTKDLKHGPAVTLHTRAGDVVFFDIRLTHAGQLADPVEKLLLRAERRLPHPAIAPLLKNAWSRALGKPSKLSIFATYGAPNADTEQYCRFEMSSRLRAGAARALPESVTLGLPGQGLLVPEMS